MRQFRINILCIFALLTSVYTSALSVDSEPNSYVDFTAKQQCFNSSDGAIKYMDAGQGKPIVLLHGVPTSGWLFRKMIPELSKGGYRVIVPDMLGFGNSDSPAGENLYSSENHAKRLLELMDHLQIKSWTLVAHDAASLWTSALIKRSPNAINKMVLMNAILKPKSINWKDQIEMGLTAKVGLFFQKIGLQKGSFVTKFIKTNLVDTHLSQSELNGYESAIIAGKTAAVFEHYAEMSRIERKGQNQFPEIDAPVSVIWGGLDKTLSWSAQKQEVMSSFNISESNLHLMQAGHFVPEEKPIEAATFIMNFIDPK